MEKHLVVMKQSRGLQDTAYEGLQHMQLLFKEGEFEETISLFTNIIQATLSIEESLTTLPKEVLSEDIADGTEKIKRGMDIIVELYENKDYGKILEVLQLTLIPSYKRWNEATEIAFQRYLLS